eukprot:scaffold491345_cov37-Prasinocladus_malaysianus.AAC.1
MNHAKTHHEDNVSADACTHKSQKRLKAKETQAQSDQMANITQTPAESITRRRVPIEQQSNSIQCKTCV